MKTFTFFLPVITALIVCTLPSQAATYNWNGLANAPTDVAGNWLVGGNPPGTPPGASDTIGNPTLLNNAGVTGLLEVANFEFTLGSAWRMRGDPISTNTLKVNDTMLFDSTSNLFFDQRASTRTLFLDIAKIEKRNTGTLRLGNTPNGDNGFPIDGLEVGTLEMHQGSTFLFLTSTATSSIDNLKFEGAAAKTLNLHEIKGTSTWSTTTTVGAISGGDNATITTGSGATATLDLNLAASGNEYTGIISGGVVLVKSGAGAVSFEGANTYTGGTAIAAGTLLVNNSNGSGLGSGAVTVQNGGTLAGGGIVALGGAFGITVENGGLVSPGNSIGALSIDFGGTSGGLNMQDGSGFVFELGSNNTSDLVRLLNFSATDWNFGATVNLNFPSAVFGNFELFRLYTDSGSTLYTGALDISSLVVNGLTPGQYNLTYNEGILSLTVIPEPSRLTLLFLVIGVFFICRGWQKCR